MRLIRWAGVGLLAAGTAIGSVGCGAGREAPAAEATGGSAADVSTVSLHVEGMT
ncbi:MAG: hypothetical protein ACE5HV_00895 [Acidobacteriota bacterium]